LPRLGDELIRMVKMANTAIWDEAKFDDSRAGMGTTLVAARFAPNKQRVYIAHVGDSRCYRLRGGVLLQLTRDHTFGALGVGGKLGETLSRAVGHEESVEVDLTVDAPEPGDRYLLCSDGLSKMLPDDAIRDALDAEPDIARTCQRLVTLANDKGGKDNVTVVLVKVERAPLSTMPPPARP
jgi:protein phosphatase